MRTSTSEGWAGSAASDTELTLRVVSAQELGEGLRARWLHWLEDGLRDGRRGRLRAEYGSVLRDAAAGHVVAETCEGPLSHAFYRLSDVQAGRAHWRIGMIGLVYTAPEARGHGLARRCIAGAEAAIADAGGVATLLWSDRPDFYERQGYRPVGRELFCGVDARVQARLNSGLCPEWEVTPPRPEDWSVLDSLYARADHRLERAAGFLGSVALGPECWFRVARRNGAVEAYAALGRGDDFRGVVHEWAGDEAGVIACVDALFQEHGPLAVMTGPAGGALSKALRSAGAATSEDAFALAQLHDPVGLWLGLGDVTNGVALEVEEDGLVLVGRSDRLPIPEEDYLALVLGRELGPSAARRWLQREGADELLSALPVPLYVWGFDSI